MVEVFAYIIVAMILSIIFAPILIILLGFAYGVIGSLLGLLYRRK